MQIESGEDESKKQKRNFWRLAELRQQANVSSGDAAVIQRFGSLYRRR